MNAVSVGLVNHIFPMSDDTDQKLDELFSRAEELSPAEFRREYFALFPATEQRFLSRVEGVGTNLTDEKVLVYKGTAVEFARLIEAKNVGANDLRLALQLISSIPKPLLIRNPNLQGKRYVTASHAASVLRDRLGITAATERETESVAQRHEQAAERNRRALDSLTASARRRRTKPTPGFQTPAPMGPILDRARDQADRDRMNRLGVESGQRHFEDSLQRGGQGRVDFTPTPDRRPIGREYDEGMAETQQSQRRVNESQRQFWENLMRGQQQPGAPQPPAAPEPVTPQRPEQRSIPIPETAFNDVMSRLNYMMRLSGPLSEGTPTPPRPEPMLPSPLTRRRAIPNLVTDIRPPEAMRALTQPRGTPARRSAFRRVGGVPPTYTAANREGPISRMPDLISPEPAPPPFPRSEQQQQHVVFGSPSFSLAHSGPSPAGGFSGSMFMPSPIPFPQPQLDTTQIDHRADHLLAHPQRDQTVKPEPGVNETPLRPGEAKRGEGRPSVPSPTGTGDTAASREGVDPLDAAAAALIGLTAAAIMSNGGQQGGGGTPGGGGGQGGGPPGEGARTRVDEGGFVPPRGEPSTPPERGPKRKGDSGRVTGVTDAKWVPVDRIPLLKPEFKEADPSRLRETKEETDAKADNVTDAMFPTEVAQNDEHMTVDEKESNVVWEDSQRNDAIRFYKADYMKKDYEPVGTQFQTGRWMEGEMCGTKRLKPADPVVVEMDQFLLPAIQITQDLQPTVLPSDAEGHAWSGMSLTHDVHLSNRQRQFDMSFQPDILRTLELHNSR